MLERMENALMGIHGNTGGALPTYRVKLRRMLRNRRWIAAHIDDLIEKYHDRWIVVTDEAIVNDADTADAAISGCKGETLMKLRSISLLASCMVSGFFRDLGLLLWDLKWEIAKDGDDLVIVDTIDTDSIRVTTEVEAEGSKYHVHFNKQSMRDYYKIMHSRWFSALNEAKQQAKRSGKPFHEHLEEGVSKGVYPPVPEVDPAFLEIQGSKFSTLLDYVRDQVNAEETTGRIQIIAREEVRYFAKAGSLDEFSRINQA